jgi:A/G-specific adenine glycosylase
MARRVTRSSQPIAASDFRRRLLGWYRSHGRDLPWRKTRDSYAILVSEVMLQQTQVATVIPYYNRWLRRFPDFKALAAASDNDVLHAWQGLGYYSRARNLHSTAKTVQDQHEGEFPRRLAQMRSLPGIGKYTAHAIASFAFNQSAPIVEANSARVLARLFDLKTPIDSSVGKKLLWRHSAQLAPKRHSARFNSALIDLGALICVPRKPKCLVCPVNRFCRTIDPENVPRKKARSVLERLTERHVLIRQQNKIMLEQSQRRWRGMWILPTLKKELTGKHPDHVSTFPFTHHRIDLEVFRERARQRRDKSGRWFAIGALDSIPIPSPHRRAIRALIGIEH